MVSLLKLKVGKALDIGSKMIKDYFAVKEIFKDITRGEILFLNKGLKHLLDLREEKRPPDTYLPGETYPSHQYPSWMVDHACALLVGHREFEDKGCHFGFTSLADIMDIYIDYPQSKGWDKTPFYNGEWEGYARYLGLTDDEYQVSNTLKP